MANEYDVVVIGAGTGGYVAAIRAAQLGLKVAVVEKQKALGGTCLLWGCIPTKALLEHAHAFKVVQDAKEWGITSAAGHAVAIDMAQVQARKDRIVAGLTKGVEFLFKKNKIDWIKGTARLAGSAAARSTSTSSKARSRRCARARRSSSRPDPSPRSVPGIAIDRQRIITSDEAIGLREVPKSIVILGSGAVGVEFASIFRRFGSDVTILELLPRLVPVEDEAVSAELEKSFRKQGITVAYRREASRRRGASARRRRRRCAARRRHDADLHADYLLVATGRGPVTTGLDAERIGLRWRRATSRSTRSTGRTSRGSPRSAT